MFQTNILIDKSPVFKISLGECSIDKENHLSTSSVSLVIQSIPEIWTNQNIYTAEIR